MPALFNIILATPHKFNAFVRLCGLKTDEGVMSKNNPENRGQVTELRVYNGKKVKPVLFINRNRRYIAAQYENGDLVMDPIKKMPIPYQQV
jgi:hypothetical protein